MWRIFRRIREKREQARAREEELAREFREHCGRWESELKPLSLSEAQRRAEILLTDPKRFACKSAPVTEAERCRLELLAPHLRQFFERYSELEASHGDEWLARAALMQDVIEADGSVSSRFLRIGEGIDGHDVFVVRPGEETIRVIGESGDGEKPEYPSIHHLVLYLNLLSDALAATYLK